MMKNKGDEKCFSQNQESCQQRLYSDDTLQKSQHNLKGQCSILSKVYEVYLIQPQFIYTSL